MKIDNSTRRHWGFLPKTNEGPEDSDHPSDFEAYSSSDSAQQLGNRYRVSAQEWLPTWRIIE